MDERQPPTIYDITADERRIATQTDIDQLEFMRVAYMQMRAKLKEADEIHAAMIARVNAQLAERMTTT